MLMLTVAFCGGGNTLFAIDRTLRLPYPLALIGPVVVGQALQDDHAQHVMMGLELLLMAYLQRSSAIVYHDYWAARRAQRELGRQARALERATLTDGLTGVANRMAFDRASQQEWRRHEREAQGVRTLGLVHQGEPLPITCSIGACSRTPAPGAPSGLAGLIQSADQALYRAKHTGRDRVVVAGQG